MGYTHYYYRPQTLSKVAFKKFSKDVAKIIEYCEKELGVNIAGWDGEGRPVVNEDEISFNGSSEQQVGMWTTNEQISIPWPSEMASVNEPNPDPTKEKTDGNWFAGHLLSQRCAPINNLTNKGSGDYETFGIDRVFEIQPYHEKSSLYFNCCKTAYRPYDIAVTACLVALKHHFPKCKVKSNGDLKDWMDGMMICFSLFGYGMDFAPEN